MTLNEMHAQLKAVLEPVGIEIGTEVLALWMARVREGGLPVSPNALLNLASTAEQLAAKLS